MENDTDIINPSLINILNFKSEKGSRVQVICVFDMFCDYNGDEAPPIPSNQIEGIKLKACDVKNVGMSNPNITWILLLRSWKLVLFERGHTREELM